MPPKVASDGVYSAIVGDNSDLLHQVGKLYLKKGDRIADVTFGKGVFWKQVDLAAYDFHPSDKFCTEDQKIVFPDLQKYDLRCLPYDDASFDVVVLDPPYAHTPGKMLVDNNYRNAETTTGMYHKDIIKLYEDGMREGSRILKEGGLLWVKCQDEIESSYQRWSHIELYDTAYALGLYGKDLFVVVQTQNPVIQHENQQHARKKHSYLWVFRKPTVSQKSTLTRIENNTSFHRKESAMKSEQVIKLSVRIDTLRTELSEDRLNKLRNELFETEKELAGLLFGSDAQETTKDVKTDKKAKSCKVCGLEGTKNNPSLAADHTKAQHEELRKKSSAKVTKKG